MRSSISHNSSKGRICVRLVIVKTSVQEEAAGMVVAEQEMDPAAAIIDSDSGHDCLGLLLLPEGQHVLCVCT